MKAKPDKAVRDARPDLDPKPYSFAQPDPAAPASDPQVESDDKPYSFADIPKKGKKRDKKE